MGKNRATAVFGGGCFWCTEAIYKSLKGVESVVSGYAGGQTVNPTYEQVSSGKSGHVEVIKLEFDPSLVSYQDLLTVFFASHDPTSPDRQGADVGSQYRSVIFAANLVQQEQAEQFIRELNDSDEHGAPIVTTVEPLAHFFPAESYHQNYYQKNQNQPYCQVVINPKLIKLRQKFAQLIR